MINKDDHLFKIILTKRPRPEDDYNDGQEN